jgi:glycosyltransferase involved in cell wall biosynthesis
MRPIRAAAIVIPARDEESTVVEAVRAAASAAALVRAEGVVEVVLLVAADSCRDATAELARRAGAQVVAGGFGGAGPARAAGVEAALARLGRAALEETWLACTDADSTVPPGWLAHQLALARHGADVVVGTVTPDFDGLSPRQRRAWLATHVAGAANGHVHGANLGVRASVAIQAGGFPALQVGEDVAIVERAAALGARVVPTAAIDVRTSARREARAPGGYSTYLAGLELLDDGIPA